MTLPGLTNAFGEALGWWNVTTSTTSASPWANQSYVYDVPSAISPTVSNNSEPDEIAWLKRRVREIEWRP